MLPFAIDRDCVAAGSLHGSRVRVYAADLDEWLECDTSDLRPDVTHKGWRAYVAGVLAGAAKAAGEPPPGIEAVIASDVPPGAGLSSSASLELSLATLHAALLNKACDAWSLARLCQRAEHEFARVPCGIMDQAAAALAIEGHAMLLDCAGEHVVQHVPLPPPADASILVVDTRVRHAHSEGEYARRRASCQAAAARLGVAHLCEAQPRQVDDLPYALRPFARHAIHENRRTLDAAEAMAAGDWPLLGRLMNESHDSLRDDFQVSCHELDTLVDAARAMDAVLGARMTGGGFGGCAIFLAPESALPTLQARLLHAFHARFGSACAFLRVRAAGGAGLI